MTRLRSGRVLNSLVPSFSKKPQNAVLNRSHPINQGLVGCWMLGDLPYGVYRDLSGNGNDGTGRLTGSSQPGPSLAFFPSHHFGQANFFSDNDVNAIDCGLGQALPNQLTSITTPTVTGWINWDGNPSGGIIAGAYTGGGGYQTGLRGSDGALSWNLNSGGNTFIMYSNTGPTHIFAIPGVWYFVAATYDGTGNPNDALLYVNTTQYQSQFTFGLTPASATFAIGSQPGGGSLAIGAAVDNVRVYNRVLSQAEILSLYVEPYLGIYDAGYNPLVGILGPTPGIIPVGMQTLPFFAGRF